MDPEVPPVNATSVESENHAKSLKEVPWQVWVAVAILGVEGILNNLPAIPQMPIAAVWLAAKCFFILGLLKGWKLVFVLSLIFGSIHVLAFSVHAPIIALLNLVLLLLIASTIRFYFPKNNERS